MVNPNRASDLRLAIISDAAPERNGVGAYYQDLAEHLRGLGAQVRLICPRFRGGHWHGGLSMPLPGDPTQRFLIPNPGLIRRRLKRLQPNAVIIPTPGPYGMLGLLLARQSGACLIIGFHTHFERLAALNDGWKLRASIAQGYLNACNRTLFKHGDLVLANSTEMVEVARTIGARHAALMGTSIPKRLLDSPPQPLELPFKRVLFAGRLAPEKNLEALVDAARALPGLAFRVAGDGPLRDWLLDQSNRLDNLDYVGWVHRRQIQPLIDATDVLVLPSTVESFGTVALEAMARGRLVLVSAECGINSWEALKPGLFRMQPGETLAQALSRLGEQSPDALRAQASAAHAAAQRLNDSNLSHWLNVLLEGEQRGLEGISVPPASGAGS